MKTTSGPHRYSAPWLQSIWGVKARSAFAATLIVALAMAASSVALILLLQRSLTGSVDAAVTDRVREVSAELQSAGPQPDASAIQDALDTVLRGSSRERTVIQVLSPSGTVVAASPDIDGEQPLLPRLQAADELVREDRSLPVEEEDTFRVIRAGVDTGAGIYTVIAAQSLESVSDSTSTVLSLLSIGYPLLLLVVGTSTFWFVGRSLRPVEAIRTKVAGIGGRELTERVPVPAAQDEVARLAVTMNQMLDRLESAQLSQRRFVADASHELRSPIATLKTITEVNLAHPEEIDNITVAEGSLAEITRLERLVNDLLLLARADEKGLDDDRLDVDLDDLLSAEHERVRSTTTLTATSRINAVQTVGNPHQLAQALRNLVDNAVRHAHDRIGLALYREDDNAIIEISDDGPGIPAKDRQRVFDRFVRLDESRERRGGGSGLGLAIVWEIIHSHGGTVIVVDSEEGALVRVTLPVKHLPKASPDPLM